MLGVDGVVGGDVVIVLDVLEDVIMAVGEGDVGMAIGSNVVVRLGWWLGILCSESVSLNDDVRIGDG